MADRFKRANRRRALRLAAIEYKGGRCLICGYDGPCASAFDFHHESAQGKDFSISSRIASLESIKAELDKTLLLCCRCHREVHDGHHPGYLDLGWNDFGDDDIEDLE